MQTSVLVLPWWGYLLVVLAVTHVTIISVTIFLHRHQAHRALELHPVASHLFRFWLWLTTGMVTREWVAVHRKHHVKCETPEDPHSPQVLGMRKVLLEGAELYRAEAANPATLAVYGRGTPDDWLERHLYARHSRAGVGLMLVIDLVLFGPAGLAVWAVQMLWIPVFAAGVINGMGHGFGYRSFVTRDASSNILPWGVLIGGEELHNNHHAYSSSAKFSSRWWEVDTGWLYIRLLRGLGLARVRRIAPRPRLDASKLRCDSGTLRSVMLHRHQVLATFARLLRRTVLQELRRLRAASAIPGIRRLRARGAVRHWLQRDERYLPAQDRQLWQGVVHASGILQTIDRMRRELCELCELVRATRTQEPLVQQLEDWCRRAEESGIGALQEFSRLLRCYDVKRYA